MKSTVCKCGIYGAFEVSDNFLQLSFVELMEPQSVSSCDFLACLLGFHVFQVFSPLISAGLEGLDQTNPL